MSFITPRASGLWNIEEDERMGYFPDDAEAAEGDDDGRTPLDKTIDRIGMGPYQWTLVSLCGFGWMADNMWLQAVAIILPRVQVHYAVPDSYIGILSASMFAGMMFGAVGWGTCSDLMGRSTAFNLTLFFTAIFGLVASFANSFTLLCISLFLLGSSVGGSMPTDGTLLLEHMPRGKEYLVTALSVFFSFGAVLAAFVALATIPKNSCPPAPAECDVLTQNMGWRYTLMTLGFLTLTMFLARMVFFRLHESPRYLVHAGRPEEALTSLQMISRFNGSELELNLEDVEDNRAPPISSPTRQSHGNSLSGENAPFLTNGEEDDPDYDEHTPLNASAAGSPKPTGETLFDAGEDSAQLRFSSNTDLEESLPTPVGHAKSPSSAPVLSNQGVPAYSATTESPMVLGGFHYQTPSSEHPSPELSFRRSAPPNIQNFKPETTETLSHDDPDPLYSDPSTSLPPRRPRPPLRSADRTRLSAADLRASRGSFYDTTVKKGGNLCCGWWWWRVPRRVRDPVEAWFDRFGMVLGPEWLKTTVLVWGAWFGMSLAYTMFNVYLPKLLEARSSVGAQPKTLEGTLWDVVIFTIGGCPGAVLGAYLIESPLGRRLSLAGSTFVTALFCIMFVVVDGQFAVTASTVGISLSATAMWAVLYGWTPEIFGTKVRGTACGTASALSRIGGMIAPILGGLLLMVNTSFPVYTSIVVFALSGFCVLLLSEDAGDGKAKGKGRGGPSLMH